MTLDFFALAVKAGAFVLHWANILFLLLRRAMIVCDSYLGGVLLGRDGQPFDVISERTRFQQIVDEMILKDVQPGSGKALRKF